MPSTRFCASFVSAKTATTHAAQVKQKLGISTAVDLYRVALRRGWVAE